MSLRHHEIAEAGHRILNPITDDKLMLLGRICRFREGQRQLDLACGKGEMLARWAQRYGIGGVGVDVSEVFLTAARERATELDAADRLEFVRGDAGRYEAEPNAFDVVSCVGATWIGGGLAGTVELMRRALKPGGLMLVGEPYWIGEPSPEAYEAIGLEPEDHATLPGTLDRFEAMGVELVEMVLADGDSWDRYAAEQWFAIDEWLRSVPSDHPDAADMREFLAHDRRTHLEHRRSHLGWGVFVLREPRGGQKS
ncbi:SAM-dependent methyltransferase [Actinacidiphila yeochonensis]|uniref:SAM-dependent methyltransferase n=1 Tax=Actinacidiphila yeochonensis TaxID=89050 RepID=UPI0005678D70|nr:methyltransferase domain-containing protein [Actinacidiphila yeochonensis]